MKKHFFVEDDILSECDKPTALDLGKIEPDPMKHIKEAQKCISELINKNLPMFGEDHRWAYLLAQAQNQLGLALKDLEDGK